MMVKVPAITVLFWVVKVLTTGAGETASDFLVQHIDPVVAVIGAGAALAVALAVQIGTTRYTAWPYWAAVTAVSVFGTMAADVMHVVLDMSYLLSMLLFSIALAAAFAAWHLSEGTLSIHSVATRRREIFYWLTVLITFGLGTAVGDLTATTFHWGYLTSAIIFALAIAVPAAAHRWLGLNPVLAFWCAYVLTRPLGASLSDWAAVPSARGGLDLGTGPVTAVLCLLIVGFVGYLAIGRAGVPQTTTTTGEAGDQNGCPAGRSSLGA